MKIKILTSASQDLIDPDKRLNKITAWLDARPDVKTWKIGEEFDVWHGDYKEII
jgi:uncharacterized protein YggL (DUF469 family)